MLAKFLPTKELIYDSELSQTALIKRLEEYVTTEEPNGLSWLLGYPNAAYWGYTSKNSFRIRRVIRESNPIQPVINGTIKKTSSGSKIHINMKFPQSIRIFFTIWLIVVFLIFVGILIGQLTNSINKNLPTFISLVPLGMFLFALSSIHFKYKKEIKRSCNDLEDILSAKIEKQL